MAQTIYILDLETTDEMYVKAQDTLFDEETILDIAANEADFKDPDSLVAYSVQGYNIGEGESGADNFFSIDEIEKAYAEGHIRRGRTYKGHPIDEFYAGYVSWGLDI